MNQYNNIIHRITGHTPYEVFYSNNKDLWQEVYNNTLNNYNKSKRNFITYNINEEALLINNIIKIKNKNKEGYQILAINKIKKKKSFNKICVVIKQKYNNGNYLIKINNDYKEYKLFKDDLYIVSFNMLRKCDKHIWEKLSELYSKLKFDIKDNNKEEDIIISDEEDNNNLNDINKVNKEKSNFNYIYDIDKDVSEFMRKFRSLSI